MVRRRKTGGVCGGYAYALNSNFLATDSVSLTAAYFSPSSFSTASHRRLVCLPLVPRLIGVLSQQDLCCSMSLSAWKALRNTR